MDSRLCDSHTLASPLAAAWIWAGWINGTWTPGVPALASVMGWSFFTVTAFLGVLEGLGRVTLCILSLLFHVMQASYDRGYEAGMRDTDEQWKEES